MTDFEDQLRRALGRKEPSPDFAARVAARAERSRHSIGWGGWRRWAAAGIAASLFAGAVGLELERRDRMRRQGEAARAQLIQALEITSSKLGKVQKKVQGTWR
jgi:hypothetical protein